MDNRFMHIILKFTNDTIELDNGRTSTTIEEHLKVLYDKGRLVWGQGTEKKNIKGIGKDKKNILNYQTDNSIPTYVFFTSIINGKRQLYVGNYINSYNKGTLSQNSPQVQYIPQYYATTVGTEDCKNYVFIEVGTLLKIEENLSEDILLYADNSKKVLNILNTTSLFYIEMSNKGNEIIKRMFENEHDRKLITEASLIEDIKYQSEIELNAITNEITVIDEPQPKPQTVNSRVGKGYKRDVRKGKNAIVIAKYLCENDLMHKDFTSAVTHDNYVEAHHLIPMEFQGEFDVSIDVEANIISLCVGCHKKLHYAVFHEKKFLLEKLYMERKSRLEKCNINIDLESLFNYYRKTITYSRLRNTV